MKRIPSLILLSCLLATVSAGSASAQTADEIVEKHLAALGGRDALGKVTSRRSTGTIIIATPNGDLAGPCEIDIKAPNKNRAYMELDLTPLGVPQKMVVEQKFDGTAGWALNSLQGDNEITGGQLQNMRNNVFPSSLLTYKAAGSKVELLPREQLDGRSLIVLQMTPKEGPSVKLYLDAATYLLARTSTRYYLTSAAMDVEQVAELSDYRVVDGVKVPFHIVNSNAAQTGTITLTKVEHNVPLADTLFAIKSPTARQPQR